MFSLLKWIAFALYCDCVLKSSLNFCTWMESTIGASAPAPGDPTAALPRLLGKCTSLVLHRVLQKCVAKPACSATDFNLNMLCLISCSLAVACFVIQNKLIWDCFIFFFIEISPKPTQLLVSLQTLLI